MKRKRDDFTESAKKLLGVRVCYTCSFPGCGRPLFAKSNNQNGYAFIGEYCHITAASPGGPRYDSTLTAEKRKSYDNGILMCETHGKLIDTDEITYSVEKLKEWKRQKEDEIYREQKEGLLYSRDKIQIESTFYDLYELGNYAELKRLLDQYIAPRGEEIDEIIYRYRFICSLILELDSKKALTNYLSLNNRNIFSIIGYIVEFNTDLLKIVKPFLKDDGLIKLVDLIENNSSSELLKNEEFDKHLKKIDKNLKLKYAMQYLFYDRYACILLDKDNKEIKTLEDSFYYKLVTSVLLLKQALIGKTSDKVNDLNDAYLWLLMNTNQIKALGFSTRLICFSVILRYCAFHKPNNYKIWYKCIDESEKNNDAISYANYLNQILNHQDSLNVEELIHYCHRIEDYTLVIMNMRHLQPQDALTFIEDHQFLLKESSEFLVILYYLNQTIFDTKYIQRYLDLYKDNFAFSCLLWKLDIDVDKNKKLCLSYAIDKKYYAITSIAFVLLLDLLVNDLEVGALFGLIDFVNTFDMAIADSLLKLQSKLGNNGEYDDRLIEYYKKAIEDKVDIQGLKHDLGILLMRKNRHDEAIEYLEKEYKQYKTQSSLMAMISFRFETGYYNKDDIFEYAKNDCDQLSQLYVAETYCALNEISSALEYYERCLILDENNKRALFKIFEIASQMKQAKLTSVADKTAVTIQSGKETVVLLFHDSKTLEGLKNENKRDVSLKDTGYASFYLKKTNDKVLFSGKEYTIVKIEHLYKYYSQKSLALIMAHPSTISITGATPEEAVQNLKEVYKNFSSSKESSLKEYSLFMYYLPISMTYVRFFSSELLANLQYLHRKSTGIDDNDEQMPLMYSKVFFYYDAIYELYHLYQIKEFEIKPNWFISSIIRNSLINECNRALNDISNNSETIGLKNDNLVRRKRNDDARRTDYVWINGFINFLKKFNVEVGGYVDLSKMGFEFDEIINGCKDERELLYLLNKYHNSICVSNSIFVRFLSYKFDSDSCGIKTFTKELK